MNHVIEPSSRGQREVNLPGTEVTIRPGETPGRTPLCRFFHVQGQ